MKKWVTTILFCFGAWAVSGQYVIQDVSELSPLKEVPQEMIYVHHTGPVLFAGEYLYYGVHCFNVQTRRTSRISGIAYVALIDQQGQTVFEHKLRLEKGKSNGDYFVPAALETGTYKLVGYTQWMKNSGLKQLFQDDIAIINPYRTPNVQAIQTAQPEASDLTPGKVNADSSVVGIKLSKKYMGTRVQGKLQIRNFKGPLGKGTYSIWIKRKEGIPFTRGKTATEFVSQYSQADKRIPQGVGDSLFLPEQRGELIFGAVRDDQDRPVSDELVFISIPGEEFVLKFATSDDNGNFYSYVRERYKDDRAIIQTQDVSKDLRIRLGKQIGMDYGSLRFSTLEMQPEWKELMVARSVRNQIENQFFEVKPDSILLDAPRDPFDGGIPEAVLLDEYTRFPTFEETLVEILNKAGYRSGPDGSRYIRILQDFETFDESFNNDPALVLIDGVMIRDHATIRDFDATRIEKIELIRDQFQMADQAYQGMMVISTFDGDYANDFQAKNSLMGRLQMARPEKNYFIQNHSQDTQDRIPDYRSLLLWKPHLELDTEPIDLEFYTSDIPGAYEVYLEGFTDYGKPISARLEFEVNGSGSQ